MGKNPQNFPDRSPLLFRQENFDEFQSLKRRGGDSNPRWVAPNLISSQAHSTTLPPLQEKYLIKNIQLISWTFCRFVPIHS